MAYEEQIKQTSTVFTAIINALVDPTFKFSKGGATTRLLTTFLSRIEKKYGVITCERLVDYCIFTAYNFRNRPQLGLPQVFGPQSIQKFGEQTRHQKYYQDRWLEGVSLSRGSLLSLIQDRREHPHAKFIYVASEETTKRRQLNQKVGFLICQTATLGWSPMSATCQQCSFVSACQKETAKKYPEIYRLRIENGNSPNK